MLPSIDSFGTSHRTKGSCFDPIIVIVAHSNCPRSSREPAVGPKRPPRNNAIHDKEAQSALLECDLLLSPSARPLLRGPLKKGLF